MTETTYHKDKVYLPKEVRETMGLMEGDRLRIEVLNEREARIVVVRSADATKRILGRLDNPPDLGRIRERLTRREIYEDNP